MRVINTAIISFAHVHAYSYARVLRELRNSNFVAIADDNKDRGLIAARAYGVKDFYVDYRDVLKRGDVEAVVIASENSKHAEVAIAAAEAGKHVLCEKPIATRLSDADAMVRAAEKGGVKFQTCFVMRYSSLALHVKKVIDEGLIGRVVAIASTNHGRYPGGWFGDLCLAGGGAIMDHTVHVADLMRWYTGSEVDRVYAEVGKNIRPELKVEDNALILLSFKSGVFASIDPSWSRPHTFPIWGDVTMEVLGTEGLISLDAFKQNVSVCSTEVPHDRLEWRYFGCDVDKEMIKHFLECIERDLKPRASGLDGRQALEVALAAYESVKKREAVPLPLKVGES